MTTEPLDPAAIQAFYRLTVKERDFERLKVDRLAAENAALREQLESAWEQGDRDASEKISMHVQMTALREQIQRVRWLAEPFLDQDDGYQHYGITLTDGVHFAVLVEDLRAALDGDQPKPGEQT